MGFKGYFRSFRLLGTTMVGITEIHCYRILKLFTIYKIKLIIIKAL